MTLAIQFRTIPSMPSANTGAARWMTEDFVTDERMDRLERRLEDFQQATAKALAQLAEALRQTHARIDEGLRHTNARIDDLERYMKTLAEAQVATTQRLDALEARIETRFDRLETTVGHLDARIRRIEKQLNGVGRRTTRKPTTRKRRR